MKLNSISQLIQKFPKGWVVWARRLFIPVAAGFLLYSAYRASGSLAPLLANISLTHLLVACLFWVSAQWIGPLSTVAFAKILDLPLGYRQLSLISILRLPAKYLPGGIWQSVARFTAYRKYDVRKSDSLTILVLEHLIALGASVTLGASVLLCTKTSDLVTRIALWLLIAGVALLIAPTFWIIRFRPKQAKALFWMAMVVASTLFFWCLAATAFVTYWSAIFDLRAAQILGVVACYLLSWATGFVAIFAPQGIGVFEWTASHLLPSTQTLSVTVTAIAGFRLITIIGDLVAWTIGMMIHQASNNRAQ